MFSKFAGSGGFEALGRRMIGAAKGGNADLAFILRKRMRNRPAMGGAAPLPISSPSSLQDLLTRRLKTLPMPTTSVSGAVPETSALLPPIEQRVARGINLGRRRNDIPPIPGVTA